MKYRAIHAIALAVALTPLASLGANSGARVTLTHVHGLTYTADGSQLIVPSHDGLAVYSAGRWSKASGPEHDYMGFSGTRSALYSSGHPAPGSGLKNPFGLIKSTDGGKSWQQLGLQGESDFHTMAASYGTNAVYVVNSHPNSRMDMDGIYSTVNDGKKWERAQARGLSSRIHGLAVHPSDPRTVAAATDDGLFLSKDGGASFRSLVSGQRVLAAAFTLDGREVWWSGFDKRPTLSALDMRSGSTRLVNLPDLGDDAISFIAQNPERTKVMAISTFKKSIFVTDEAGGKWARIVDKGETTGDQAVAGKRH